MKVLFVLAAVVSAASALSFFEVVMEEWEAWKLQHGKVYTDPTEEKFRLKIYAENKQHIAKHNNLAYNGKHTYWLKMNHYGDLLPHEFAARMNGYRYDLKNSTTAQGNLFMAPLHYTAPTEVNWVKKGYVTPIKNQGQCGSCWAFSTTGSLEGQHFRKTGKLVSLSEQQLVDCSTSYGNNGCNGGLMDNAFKYIKDNGGVDTEKSYPYDAMDEQCHFKKKDVGADDTGFTDVPQGDESALQTAVASVGPVSVAIDAGQRSFQFYSHGVYSDDGCDPSQLDHGVLVVGYGEDEDQVSDTKQKYWLVKNSWGTSWGMDGYIKMAKDMNNMCGIASAASYPTV